MDIKGSGVIHPQYPSNIVEIILMEKDQFNIDNSHFEKIDISLFNSNLTRDQLWRPSEKNINHYLIEKEDSNNNQIERGIIEIINKIKDGNIKIPGMDGIIILGSHSHQSQT